MAAHRMWLLMIFFFFIGFQALADFWNGRGGWYPTWQAAGEDAALQVDYIRAWAL